MLNKVDDTFDHGEVNIFENSQWGKVFDEPDVPSMTYFSKHFPYNYFDNFVNRAIQFATEELKTPSRRRNKCF
jgi:hypothetical protein